MVNPKIKLRALVVDDDDTLRAALNEYVTQQGMETTAGRDGLEAIEIINGHPEPFDVVLTDLIMPKAGGLEVLRAARQRSHDTQVVIITGFASLETAIDSMHQGAFDYVTKPFKLVEIGLILGKIAERKTLIDENKDLSERIQSLYVRLDMLKENRSKMEKFMSETTEKLEFQSRKIDECVEMIRTISLRIEPYMPSVRATK
jgi:DNA-binding NtrC family response regulator